MKIEVIILLKKVIKREIASSLYYIGFYYRVFKKEIRKLIIKFTLYYLSIKSTSRYVNSKKIRLSIYL